MLISSQQMQFESLEFSRGLAAIVSQASSDSREREQEKLDIRDIEMRLRLWLRLNEREASDKRAAFMGSSAQMPLCPNAIQ